MNPEHGVEAVLDAIVASLHALLLAMTPPPSVTKELQGATMQLFEAGAGPAGTETTGETSAHDATSALEDDPIRVRILVEEGTAVDGRAFALSVATTLADHQGWAAAGRPFRLGRGSRDTVDIIVARPSTVDRLCRPLRTGGYYSCGRSGRAVINEDRWLHGAAAYTGTLADYRTYVINHEVGHLLAMPHLPCPHRGSPAPVMQQQSKSLSGCTPTSLPSAVELARLRQRSRWREAGVRLGQ